MSSSESAAVVRLHACPVCSHADLSDDLDVPGRWIGAWLFEPYRGKLALSRCRNCQLVFVNPRPSSALLSEFYRSEHYVCHRLDDPDSMRAKAEYLLTRIEHHQPERGLLLDFGCGSGWLLAQARERGWRAMGYDVGQSALEHCRARGLPVTGALDQIDDRACDAIVMHHVLEHVEDFSALFEHITRILKPGGRLFVEVPNATSLRARASLSPLSRYCSVDERYRAFPIHLSYFSRANLSLLLGLHGFATAGVETYGLGIDELFWNSESERVAYATSQRATRKCRFKALRSAVKRAIYGLELGENLLVAAQRPVVTAKREQSAPYLVTVSPHTTAAAEVVSVPA